MAIETTNVPYLHPNLAQIYQERLARMASALNGEEAAEAREVVRSRINVITLHPDGDGYRIEVRGEL